VAIIYAEGANYPAFQVKFFPKTVFLPKRANQRCFGSFPRCLNVSKHRGAIVIKMKPPLILCARLRFFVALQPLWAEGRRQQSWPPTLLATAASCPQNGFVPLVCSHTFSMRRSYRPVRRSKQFLSYFQKFYTVF
jgi:hypothetical protein